MGKNKLKKFKEMETLEGVYQYPFKVMSDDVCPLRGKWREEVFHNENPIVLELGCGKGEYTIGLAQRFPGKNFIGIDIKGARMWTGAKQRCELGLTNAAFLRTNIELLDRFFLAGEVDEIWITFPDPQMKRVRKRLTATNFMHLYSKILRPEGIIHLKTDSPFLYTYTHIMAEHNGLKTIADTTDLYGNPDVVGERDILNIKTFYEQQWLSRGLTIKYIAFPLPQPLELAEPDVEIEPDTYRSFSRGELQCPELCNPKVTYKNV
ncbi:MAG: tRNA (guanosine(46)-N7)-methyltransferase TrmB [Muribaculaceae bacterium]